MASRSPNKLERYLLANYQHLLSPAERMIARSLVSANFDLHGIPKMVWNRVWLEFPGIQRENPWKFSIDICIRLVHEHRHQIHLPEDLRPPRQTN